MFFQDHGLPKPNIILVTGDSISIINEETTEKERNCAQLRIISAKSTSNYNN